MAPLSPYTYIQCPCSDPSTLSRGADAKATTTDAGQDEDERTFDPRAPRANYSLYPLEYLLYCEDCHQIRCPRCVAEEIAAYYCPNCLFEVPFSNLRSEGNRCTRSCFQCPICVGPLSVSSLEAPPNPNLLAAENVSAPSGPYILTCSYCNWSSEEIGIKFDKPNGISSQLAKLRNGGRPRMTAKERRERRKEPPVPASGSGSNPVATETNSTGEAAAGPEDELDVETQFANLLSFYKAQLADASTGAVGALSPLGDLGFNSPGSLSRIMSLYTGGSSLNERRNTKTRAAAMREALDSDEGLQVASLDDSAAIAQLHAAGWDGTSSTPQAAAQQPVLGCESAAAARRNARFASSLRPVPYLLRAKRSKRCPVCRHIISKPESKVAATRFRIRLVAGSYIPTISIRPLAAPGGSSTAAAGGGGPELLTPLKPVQYLLTFKNPIFEAVKVTLATPATTPGRFASKVTVLCPQFEIDANTDVWDEALKDGDKDRRRGRKGEDGGQQTHQAEAGKIWERGRNWVSIVVEVVPASLRLDVLAIARRGDENVDLGSLREDEDILEIPMFVRIEWEAEAGNEEVGSAPGKEKEATEKRELAYWCVLGIGRISQE